MERKDVYSFMGEHECKYKRLYHQTHKEWVKLKQKDPYPYQVYILPGGQIPPNTAQIAPGVVVETRISSITGRRTIAKSLPDLARQYCEIMGIGVRCTPLERSYLDGRHNSVPTGRVVGVSEIPPHTLSYGGYTIEWELVDSKGVNMNGKGSKDNRVKNRQQYRDNYDKIFGKPEFEYVLSEMPSRFYETGTVRWVDLVVECSSYAKGPPKHARLVEFLKDRPHHARMWIQYSEDQRVKESYYIREAASGAWFVGNPENVEVCLEKFDAIALFAIITYVKTLGSYELTTK